MEPLRSYMDALQHTAALSPVSPSCWDGWMAHATPQAYARGCDGDRLEGNPHGSGSLCAQHCAREEHVS